MKKFIALVLICFGIVGGDAFGAVRAGGASVARGRTPAVATAQNTNTTSTKTTTSRGRAAALPGQKTSASSVKQQKQTVAPKSSGVTARAATTQKAISNGTKISGANANVIVSEECKEKYYGCMDSFCMLDNANGGRCLCSNRNAELDKVLEEIQKLDEQSYAMATEGVERINMGADADAVDAMVNKIAKKEQEVEKKKARSLNLDLWNSSSAFDDDDNVFSSADDIANLTGDALHSAVADVCVNQIPECSKDLSMLKMMYAQQIRSDCTAYENSLKKQRNESAKKLQTAQTALREAALEQHQNANKYDLGQCTIRFKQCMQQTAGCGDDFSKCASVVATDKAQTAVGKKAKTKDYKIQGAVSSITIAASTYDTLLAKKPMCESVTKQCVSVQDKVWDAFLREAAPELKSAELIAESNVRMNCIANISECFQKACKDNMDPNDPDGSYDMCLSRPETMRSLCKVQIDPCEAAEPKVLDYVYARLASMRVDSCTTEVKECLQSDDRCGSDYSKCIGLDLVAIRDMCPLEKLVGCQENGQAAMWETIDNIVQGIYLDVDNSMLNNCKNLVNAKMVEICGGEDECLAFENDNVIGADSLTSYKANDGSFVIEGLLTFGNVKVKETQSTADNVKFGKYELDISGYSNQINKVDGTSAVKERVLSTLQSTQNKINQKIALLTSDSKIMMCVNGRDMKQIRGRESKTEARFPNLLDSSIMAIINSGLEKAGKNYAKKYDELLAKAMEEQGDEKKAALCAAMAEDSSSVNKIINFSGVMSKLGVNGGGYEVRHVIDGMTMNQLMAQQKAGKGEFIQTDASGNMIGKIVMNAVYSAENNTCKITTITTMCDGIKAVYDESSSSCGGGGIALFGSQGGCGGSGLLSIGGGGSTQSSSTYRGTICTKMASPTIKTEDVKM
jgi:hypothetical protein